MFVMLTKLGKKQIETTKMIKNNLLTLIFFSHSINCVTALISHLRHWVIIIMIRAVINIHGK